LTTSQSVEGTGGPYNAVIVTKKGERVGVHNAHWRDVHRLVSEYASEVKDFRVYEEGRRPSSRH
jgi:hypothetical protein